MISVETEGKVAILRLNRGVTNALNLQLINQINENLRKLIDDSSIHSLVIGSANEKFFSIGFDIPELYHLNREDFEVFYKAFNQTCLNLYTISKPTIASITGHAIAGGCLLALCCDYRFIAEGRKLMGINEIKLGVPVPYTGHCILRDLVGAKNAREIVELGDFYHPEESLQLSLVDQVLPTKQMLAKAIEKARLLGESPQEAFAMIKHNRVDVVKTHILKHLREKERLFINRWFSREVRERLKEAMKKF